MFEVEGSISICFSLLGTETPLPLLVEVAAVEKNSHNHENKVEVQEAGEAATSSDRLRQGNAEEFGLVKDGDGLYHCHSFR